MLHNAVYIIDGERAVGFLALLIATPTQHPYLISGRTQVSLRETGTARVGVANSSRPSQFSLPPKFRLEEMMAPFRVTRRTITPQLSITFVARRPKSRDSSRRRERWWRDPIEDLRDLSSLFLFLRSDRWRTIGRERRGN